MAKKHFPVILAGLALSALGAADMAAPSGALGEDETRPEAKAKWNFPVTFSARWIDPGVRLWLGAYYSTWEGRSLQMNEGILSVAPANTWMVWFSKQKYHAKGRSAGSRFDLDSDSYGVRGLVKQPTEPDGSGGVALQLEIFRPGDATSRTGSSSAIFNATRAYTVSVAFSDHDADYQLAYTNEQGAATGHADVFDIGYGKDFTLGPKFDARLQAHGIGQRVSVNGGSSKQQLRLALYGASSYKLAEWLNLEGDLTLMPFGIPLAGGRLTPLSSFFVYNPGSAVDALRNGFVAVGSLRLMAHARF